MNLNINLKNNLFINPLNISHYEKVYAFCSNGKRSLDKLCE